MQIISLEKSILERLMWLRTQIRCSVRRPGGSVRQEPSYQMWGTNIQTKRKIKGWFILWKVQLICPLKELHYSNRSPHNPLSVFVSLKEFRRLQMKHLQRWGTLSQKKTSIWSSYPLGSWDLRPVFSLLSNQCESKKCAMWNYHGIDSVTGRDHWKRKITYIYHRKNEKNYRPATLELKQKYLFYLWYRMYCKSKYWKMFFFGQPCMTSIRALIKSYVFWTNRDIEDSVRTSRLWAIVA